jgi:hypothetical protein
VITDASGTFNEVTRHSAWFKEAAPRQWQLTSLSS